MDDLLVKSQTVEDHVANLCKAFSILRKNHMKLKPVKSAFGVHVGKFLGFMITERGIEANPDKI